MYVYQTQGLWKVPNGISLTVVIVSFTLQVKVILTVMK